MKKKGKFVLRKAADEYILIPYKESAEQINRVITLSETAAFIYDHMDEAADSQEMAALVGKEYDIAPKEIKEDVEAVLKHLKQLGLLEQEV